MTDRGPGGGVLLFAPRLQSFRLDIDQTTGAIGGFQLTATTLFRQGDGGFYSGLNPTLLNGSAAVLGGSLDPEGLARLRNGNLLVSDEYGPSVIEFTPDGRFVRQYQTPSNLLPRNADGTLNYVDGRPTITFGRQDNRGFEGLTVSPDGRTAYTILQDPLVNEGRANNGNADGRFSRNLRIVSFDMETGASNGQYIYQLEPIDDINGRIDGTANDFSVTQNGSGTQFDKCSNTTGTVQTQVALGGACPAGLDLIPNYLYSFRLTEAEYNQLAGVPEPATWTTMMLGLGLVGNALRRRRVRFA